MDWLSLEGIPRVNACYRVWKRRRRDLKQKNIPRQSRKYLKEDVRYEFDELIDAILCLHPREYTQLLSQVKSNKLYQLLRLYYK
jgi:hypothetical protein